jgi:hypothetical protein
MVRMNEHQQVVHFGTCASEEETSTYMSGEDRSESKFSMQIDEEKRMIYTRLHSAGMSRSKIQGPISLIRSAALDSSGALQSNSIISQA